MKTKQSTTKKKTPTPNPPDLKTNQRIINGNIINLDEKIPKPVKTDDDMMDRYHVSGGGEIVKPEIEKEKKGKKSLTLRQELFCQFYVINAATRFNATQSYAHAAGYDLYGADTEEIRDLTTGEIIKKSEKKRLENICAVSAQQLLRIIKVQDRITELFNELKKDKIVDSEMMKLILQDDDPESKRMMIREYNKLMKRITDKVEHSGGLTLADGLIAISTSSAAHLKK